MFRMLLLSLLSLLGPGTAVLAQEWPAKTVHVVVGYPPGGGHDFVARVIGQRLGEVLKETFVVENRTGASGTIAAAAIAKGPADGYAFLVASPAETVVGALAGLKMAYDWERDLAPVTLVGETPLAIAIHPSVDAKTIQELLALAKRSPGLLAYGTPGSGSSMHFAGESLKAVAGVFIVHIPYRGAGPAMTDLLGGQVPMGIMGMPPVVGPYKAGKVRIVAVTSERRSSATPEVPAMAELPGFAGYHFTNWQGIFMAAKTPPAVIERLAVEIGKAVREPAIRDKLLAAGVDPAGLTTSEFAAFLVKEKTSYSNIARARAIRAED